MDTEQEKNTTEHTPQPEGQVPEVQAVQPETHVPKVQEVQTEAPVDLTSEKTPFYKNTQFMKIAVVAAVLILGASYYVYTNKYLNGGVVAIVNGDKIYRDAYENNVKRMEIGATQQGIDITDPAIEAEIKKQSLQILVDNSLLMAAAAKAGVVATDEEVQAKFDELVVQIGGEEALLVQLAEAELTKEELLVNIYERVLIDNYFEEMSDIEEIVVTDEDIATFLEAYDSKDLPPLAEIRAEIEKQIVNQKQQEIIDAILEDLRAGAKIEEKI